MPPEELKPQSSINFYTKKFSIYYFLFKTDSKIAIQDDKQQDSIDREIEAKIKGFFATNNLNGEMKEVES